MHEWIDMALTRTAIHRPSLQAENICISYQTRTGFPQDKRRQRHECFLS